jgi:hypothetical protein
MGPTPEGIAVVFVLWILLPASAILAAVFAWRGFRRKPVEAGFIWKAFGLLAAPYVLVRLIHKDGLEMAFSPNAPWQMSIVVLIGMVVVAPKCYRRDRDAEAERLRAVIQQEFRERFPRDRAGD